MAVSSAWQEETELRNACVRGRGKVKVLDVFPKNQCFVNKYVVCQKRQTLGYPHCGKSLF